jgi:hypothetical protein
MSAVKHAVRAILPNSILQPLQWFRYRGQRSQYDGLSTKDVFTKIYEDNAWGSSDQVAPRMYSGTGSDDAQLVAPYVRAVREVLAAFPRKPNVVDLGCGNFQIGAQLRDACGDYIACDIVEPVIMANKQTYAHLDVDFRVLDLVKDELPAADVVFIRQVLQHLSNDDIANALPRIASRYRYLILTEHLPKGRAFVPNLDKRTGPDVRLGFNSGVVLTSPPFDFEVTSTKRLCEVEENGGIIASVLYRLH